MNFKLSTDAGDVDLFGEVTGLGGFEEVLKFSERLDLYDFSCNILSLEGLIKSKKRLGRPKDLKVIPELEALLERSQFHKKRKKS